MLAAGASAAALVLAGPSALTGCTASAPAPEQPDPLESLARRAEADAAQALAAAQRVTDADAGLAAAARALAADRMAHATTLRAELRRVHPNQPPSAAVSSPPVAPPSAAPPPPGADPAGTRSALTQAMHAAQDEAAALVLTLPGYRAALLASVAACCATHAALLS
ncbi:MAG: hypothetical protein ACRDS0_23650 [Pseudonocardiaceae bacterium]